jgi:hypothetical protein
VGRKFKGQSDNVLAKYYKHSIFGDTLELQPLDSSLFALVKDWVRKMCSSRTLPANGPAARLREGTHFTPDGARNA